MRVDQFDDIWNEVHGHSKAVDPLLVQSWVRDSWREIGEARTWSWLRKKLVISIPAPYSTGTVAVTSGSTLLTFTGAVLTQAMVGLQFRQGGSGSIYDVQSVDPVANTANIWPPFADNVSGGITTGLSYKLFTAYIVPPDSDFFSWIAVTDPNRRKRLRLHVNQETIDYHDASRSMAVGSGGGPACLSGIDWTPSYSGKVFPTIPIFSFSNAVPASGGSYTGQTESVFIIRISVSGMLGVAQFTWQKDNGPVSGNVLTDIAGNVLQDNVYITFPSGVSFNDGVLVLGAPDTFIVRVSPRANAGLPRYELYPHPTAAMTLNCTYSTRVHDIDEPGFTIPYTMRGDVIKLGALSRMARYPGTDQKPNPFSQVARANFMEQKFQDSVSQLVTADDFIMETNVMDGLDQLELALLPWMTTSGTGMRPTQEYDPMDGLIR